MEVSERDITYIRQMGPAERPADPQDRPGHSPFSAYSKNMIVTHFALFSQQAGNIFSMKWKSLPPADDLAVAFLSP